LSIVAYLVLEIGFVTVALICVPTEDGWERARGGFVGKYNYPRISYG